MFDFGSYKPKHVPRRIAPEITPKEVWYRNDGTGRDTYAMYLITNSGLLVLFQRERIIFPVLEIIISTLNYPVRLREVYPRSKSTL